jgi:uncharacterized protein (TIGR00730 family)
MQNICVFCGSSDDVPRGYRKAAREVGAELAKRGLGVVFGGGSVGLMGEVANAAMAAGGQVVGVIPRKLEQFELGHRGITRLEVVQDMHERKARMAELSDAFVALPGGWGTWEELFEAVTWTQLGYHRKPVGVLNVDGYYDHLIAFIDHAADEGFVRPHVRHLLAHATDIGVLLQQLGEMEIPEFGDVISK